MDALSDAMVVGRAKIINMSFGNNVHWSLAWTQLPMEAKTALFRHVNGILLFAGAGNESRNVDEQTCFLRLCWESHWNAPCENAGVLCVGALERNARACGACRPFGRTSVPSTSTSSPRDTS